METATRLGLHLLCFAMPLVTLSWGLSAPHGGLAPLVWLAVVVVAVALDFHARPERRPPISGVPTWPFDAALYALAALQLVNVGLLLAVARDQGLGALDTWTGVLLVGASSGYSAIVVAHELIHRPQAHFRWLGRVLMGSVLYEHFTTEHVRGHHRRVGTDEDPATARFDEALGPFLRRTVPGQLRSAWRLETRRLGGEDMALLDRRQAGNRVLHGLVGEWSAAALVLAALGPAPFLALLLQAALAVLLLETVNYVEHWGLSRHGKRVGPVDSWDSEGWFTYYTLVGLSRHADHHAWAARPWQDLRAFDESPKMPWGYWATVVTALFRNRLVRERLTAELRAKRLGPFTEPIAAK